MKEKHNLFLKQIYAKKYKNNQLKIINDCLHFMDQSGC